MWMQGTTDMALAADHYATLQVQSDATQAEIKRAYSKIARANHPDLNPSADAKAVMDKANKAWAVLGDAEKRKEYDRTQSGSRRAKGPTAGDISRWTPENSDEYSRRIRDGRRLGEEATVSGDNYAIEWVAFGNGDDTVERAALTCNGECLETENGVEATSHPAASDATHKRFAGAHQEVLFQFKGAETKRDQWAKAVGEIRTAMCKDDPGMGEGNTVAVNGNIYSIAVVPFEDGGKWKGQRVLMRNGAAMESLPMGAVATRFASSSDYDMFFSEKDQLEDAVHDLLEMRPGVWKQAAGIRSDLDPGDSVEVDGVAYTFGWVEWSDKGVTKRGAVLCADGTPLEMVPGRLSDKDHRGTNLENLFRFRDHAGAVTAQFDQLRKARRDLLSAVVPMMQDLAEGDVVRYGDADLHVENLDWRSPYNTGKHLTLCWADVALNPHFGTITSEGYRRAALSEATTLARSGPNIRNALRPIMTPRADARRISEQRRQAAEWQAQQRQMWARKDARAEEKAAKRAAGGGKLRGLGRLLGGSGEGAPPEDLPPPPAPATAPLPRQPQAPERDTPGS